MYTYFACLPLGEGDLVGKTEYLISKFRPFMENVNPKRRMKVLD